MKKNNAAKKDTAATSETETIIPALSHAEYQALETKLNDTEAKLNEATTALEDSKNQLLRHHADLQNIRKRTAKDVQDAHRHSLEGIALELMPVLDSLERGLDIEVNENALAKQMHAGMDMTLKLFKDTLHKFSIKVIDPLNSAFDPTLHQAISTLEKPDTDPNTVLQVLQKGYTLHDRLIRPALVIVSK